MEEEDPQKPKANVVRLMVPLSPTGTPVAEIVIIGAEGEIQAKHIESLQRYFNVLKQDLAPSVSVEDCILPLVSKKNRKISSWSPERRAAAAERMRLRQQRKYKLDDDGGEDASGSGRRILPLRPVEPQYTRSLEPEKAPWVPDPNTQTGLIYLSLAEGPRSQEELVTHLQSKGHRNAQSSNVSALLFQLRNRNLIYKDDATRRWCIAVQPSKTALRGHVSSDL